jgi:hypothetical protein
VLKRNHQLRFRYHHRPACQSLEEPAAVDWIVNTVVPIAANDAPLIGERAATCGRGGTEGGDEHAEEPYSIPLSAFSRLAFACAFSQGS